MSEVVEKAPALGISLQAAIGDATLVFQTHVDQATDVAGLNALVDKLAKVVERQKAKVALEQLRPRVKTETATLERMREDRQRIESELSAPQEGRKNQQRNLPQLEQQRKQADANEKRLMEIISDIHAEIAAAEKLVAGA